MSTQASDSSYISDPGSASELSRLLYQDRLLTTQMGGLLAEQEQTTLAALHHVLDLACGPGGWVLDLASACPQGQVIGVDISQLMISYAQTQAAELGGVNAQFLVMDVTTPLSFPGDHFDLVNARFLSTFMPTRRWPTFLSECLRILRPGGTLRVTDLEFGMSNSPAHERMCAVCIQAMKQGGISFSVDGRHLGMLAMLERLMENAGVQFIRRRPYMVNYSAGSPVHHAWYRDLLQVWKLGRHFVVGSGVVTAEEFDQIYHQCMSEMIAPSFCAVWFFATLWGTKPLDGERVE